jgi:uncharacterized SAM-binding protein YcdF (DUF218 family)
VARAIHGGNGVFNDLLVQWGLEGWKPALGALLLPPVPLLLLVLLGAALLRRRAGAGWLLLLSGVAGIWLCSTIGFAQALQRALLPPAHALTQQELTQLQGGRKAGAAAGTAIVVLGAGREGYAPEYGSANLTELAMARLRYGLWLSRETGLPLAFSGGVGHAQSGGPSEAEVATLIATRDFGRPPKWTEDRSRDTRENAARSVELLQGAGVTRIVLVTHAWHMPRAQRAFEQAIERRGGGIALVAAPLGLARGEPSPLRWLPSTGGFAGTYRVLHEVLGLYLGA